MSEVLNAMKPCSLALLDYYNGREDAVLTVRREDGDARVIRVQEFFRASTHLGTDQKALDVCRGRVLDVGAGTGIHSLALQGQGVDVCAVDVSPEACEIMRDRGVNEVHCADFRGFAAARGFDTILILGRGLGMVETLAGLDRFLEDTRRHLLPQGQILLSSWDVRCTTNPVHLRYQDRLKESGRYFGELRMRFEYEGQAGPMFSFLYVDPETLANHAVERGWSCDVLVREEDGNYLGRLTSERSVP